MNNNIGEISSTESIFILGDTDPYSDSDREFYEFDYYDSLYFEDTEYVEGEKENNSYHIGSCYSYLPYSIIYPINFKLKKYIYLCLYQVDYFSKLIILLFVII